MRPQQLTIAARYSPQSEGIQNKCTKKMKVFFLILLLASCTTTKYIDREKVVVDSSVVEQNEALQRTLHETIERHEKEKEQWENTGITFYENYEGGRPTKSMVLDSNKVMPDSAIIRVFTGGPTTATDRKLEPYPWPKTRIILEDGKLKSIEGPVKSFNQNKYAKSSELSEARTTIDSMKAALAKKETNLEKTTVTVTKKIKTRFFPWWLLILIPVVLLIGSFAENRFKYIRHFQRIFSLLKI